MIKNEKFLGKYWVGQGPRWLLWLRAFGWCTAINGPLGAVWGVLLDLSGLLLLASVGGVFGLMLACH